MKKAEYISRYGEDAYNEYKKKQAELSKQWRLRNKEKARKYGREYYYRLKNLAMLSVDIFEKDKNN